MTIQSVVSVIGRDTSRVWGGVSAGDRRHLVGRADGDNNHHSHKCHSVGECCCPRRGDGCARAAGGQMQAMHERRTQLAPAPARGPVPHVSLPLWWRWLRCVPVGWSPPCAVVAAATTCGVVCATTAWCRTEGERTHTGCAPHPVTHTRLTVVRASVPRRHNRWPRVRGVRVVGGCEVVAWRPGRAGQGSLAWWAACAARPGPG